jgi:phosphoribosylanthranilate isomerase
MKRTRVKICGLTRLEDVRVAVASGADALGFVFAQRSRRRLEPGAAGELSRSVPPFVSRVGLFQDQDFETVKQIVEQVPFELLQFHGSEPADFCSAFGLPYIKAVSMAEEGAVEVAQNAFADAAALLLDSHLPGKAGGTGEVFDWTKIGDARMPLIIAGGLSPENVCAVVRSYNPFAVDVSSGVESDPGIKDASLIRQFIQEVDRGNRDND